MLTGSIYMFAGSTAPTGFLVCDGSAVSRSTYSSLYNIIGTMYGSGDGSTTFNLPDLSGRVVLGASQGYARGTYGGESTHALSSSEIPAHHHEVPQHGHGSEVTVVTPKLSHTCTQPAFSYNSPSGGTTYTGGGSQAYSGSSSVGATRSASVAMSDHASAPCTISGGIEDCQAFDTEPCTGGNGHSNMQPYLVMNYVIYTGEA